MARDGFRIFDADTHVGPDMQVIERYLSEQERARLDGFAKYRKTDKRTGGVEYVMGRRYFKRALGQAADAPKGDEIPDRLSSDGAAWQGRDPNPAVDVDPVVRIADMELEGVDVNLMLPSSWWGTWTILDEPAIEQSMYRAYHDWMKDYCGAFPDRLFGVVLVSGRNVDAGLAELARCARERWPLAVLCYAPHGMPLDHPDLEPYWAAAQEYELSLVLHTFTAMPPYAPGSLDTWQNHWLQRSAAHPWCGQRDMAAIIGAGILDRYPRLNLGVLEAGHGWLPFWVKRLDEHAHKGPGETSMACLPSEYVASGRYFQSIEISEGEPITRFVTDQLGDGLLIYASDYPHKESWFPHSVDSFMAWDLPREMKSKLLWDNAVRFYKRYQPSGATAGS
jgi:predicted TIM-barrel fold metal-dependent hydrolase